MADRASPTTDSENAKHGISQADTDQSEVGHQPPLKKSASNVPITLNIRYKTQTFPVQCDLYDTLKDLKEKIDRLTDVAPHIQKLVNKSISSGKHDDTTTTLKDLQLLDGQTLLLVGATRADIASTTTMKTSSGATRDNDDVASATAKKEPLSKQTRHEKVIKAGRPENAQVGIKNRHDPLPASIDGMLMSIAGHSAKKARLTFKLESDELWINTGKRLASFL